jgi:hypothetical protein
VHRRRRKTREQRRTRCAMQQMQQNYDSQQKYDKINQKLQTRIDHYAKEAFDAIFEKFKKCASRTKIG